MEFNQAINLLWPLDLEQNIARQREEDEEAILTELTHNYPENCWNTENAWQRTRADC